MRADKKGDSPAGGEVRMQQAYADLYRTTLQRNIYPSEALVRIFMGSYPSLPDFRDNVSGKRILDVGCGDGRNIKLFRALGMQVSATETDTAIIQEVARGLGEGVGGVDLQVGFAHRLPFPGSSFDFVVSWNSSYYMGDSSCFRPFESHVREFSRVCAEGGYLLLSVPKRTHSIFAEAQPVSSCGSYVHITRDPNGVRNGIVFRVFEDHRDLEKEFQKEFDSVGYASIENFFFSLHLDWHICVLRKKSSSVAVC